MEHGLPFPSKHPAMKLTTDGLVNDTRKQGMSLTLTRPTMPATDQTPTPTRFIRNCEEVGLFQDLRNVNPFDETFKKALEKGIETPPLTLNLSRGGDDTLHTPHIFPVIECIEGEKVIRQEADTSLKHSPVPQAQLEMTIGDKGQGSGVADKADGDPETVQVLLRMPNGTFLQLSTKPVAIAETAPESIIMSSVAPSTVILNAPPTPDKPSEPEPTVVKQKLKEALLKANKRPSEKPRPEAEPKIKSGRVPIPRDPTMGAVIRRASSTNSEEDSADDKRRKALERNRAAAVRCREKRKVWVSELGKRADAMMITNQNLVGEISQLREEVHRLKTLLLAHKDCPVTLALANAVAPSIPAPAQKPARERLSLDIEQARRASIQSVDLDSPLVRSDEVLSSVAPVTPNETEKLTFSEESIDIDSAHENEAEIEERIPVIQLNPNVLIRGPLWGNRGS